MTSGSDDTRDGIGPTIVQVVEDAKAYAAAQVAVVRETAAARWRAARIGLVLGATAAVLALAALVALLVGLILSLTPVMGPFLATLVVILSTLAIAGLLGWIAGRRIAAALEPIE